MQYSINTKEYSTGGGNRYNESKFDYWQEASKKKLEKRKRKEEKYWIKFGL